MTTSRRRRLGVIGLLALLVLATALLSAPSRGDTLHLTAHFPRTVGLYEGSEVRLMGVPVGTVTKVEPEGKTVRVEVEYDGQYRLAEDARAFLVASSIISDRFVQLSPIYSGHGAPLPDGADLPVERTSAPVELDEVFDATNTLLEALGPKGANRHGSLSRLLAASADTLAGQGPQLRSLLRELGGAAGTMGAGSDDFFGTVEHLRGFTKALATNDSDVRRFNRQMADVAQFLATERHRLSQVLIGLARTFGHVETFVGDNRELLAANVAKLTRISTALVAERQALTSLLEVTPLGVSNLAHTFDTTHQALRARANEDQLLKSLDLALCDSLLKAGLRADAVCQRLSYLLNAGGTR